VGYFIVARFRENVFFLSQSKLSRDIVMSFLISSHSGSDYFQMEESTPSFSTAFKVWLQLLFKMFFTRKYIKIIFFFLKKNYF
jgi:hypothetical protein